MKWVICVVGLLIASHVASFAFGAWLFPVREVRYEIDSAKRIECYAEALRGAGFQVTKKETSIQINPEEEGIEIKRLEQFIKFAQANGVTTIYESHRGSLGSKLWYEFDFTFYYWKGAEW